MRQGLAALAFGLAVVITMVPEAFALVPMAGRAAQVTEMPVPPGPDTRAAGAAVPTPQPAVLPVPAPEPAAAEPAPPGEPMPPAAAAPAPVPVVLPEGPLSAEVLARLVAGVAGLEPRRPLDAARLKQFYEQRHYAAAWFSGDAAETLIAGARQLRQTLSAAELEGLVPADYHLAAIDSRLAGAGALDAAHRAEFDLLLTDALIAYAGDLHRGRLAPRAIAAEFALVPAAMDPVATAREALAASDLPAFLARLAPAGERYRRLREALRLSRAFERAGGWPRVPEGPKLEPGRKDPVVKALRRRLVVTGELDRKLLAGGTDYDRPLRLAVQRFQARHGLPADGVIGAMTYAALNVSAAERVATVIANMERERWMPEDLGPRHVLVNIPGFSLTAVIGGKTALEMPVIVGTKVRRTPIFASQITSLIWNPTWSVPRKLAREDILPKLRANPSYLADQNIVLYSGSFAGKRVDSTRINWQAVDDISGYRLRQMPGSGNALGQVKFNIPNDFDVYLHDTPHREKFVKSVRTFSSGCVRVGNPLGLAELLLTDMPEWTAERRKLVLDKGDTRLVPLKAPMPVFLLYQTAWVGEDGELQFREDIYGRDSQILRALHRIEEPPARPPVGPGRPG
ncbi:MAG: L,D-transpeptidase family protein [Rhodospirillaceae bacterium]